MKEHNKVALFDFCETLVNFQTADAFVEYVRANCKDNKHMHKWNNIRLFLIKTRIIPILSRLLPKISIHKRIVLYQLKGKTKIELSEYAQCFYKNMILPNLIHEVIDELKKLQLQHYKIVLVSGGYDIYINLFAKDFGIDNENIITTRIKYKNGICMGIIDGLDCLFDNKIKLISEKFEKDEIYSISYSDSKTDLPLLNWADKGIVVRCKNRNKWNLKFDEILWEK